LAMREQTNGKIEKNRGENALNLKRLKLISLLLIPNRIPVRIEKCGRHLGRFP
jgi:hypothetical protein